MRKRSQARENVLKILYQAEIVQRDVDSASEMFWERFPSVDATIKKFTERLAKGVEERMDVIDEKISQYATNWQLKRMAVIDRNILRMGVYELIYAEDIPPKVSINESVELAKKYGDLESSKFVNGILDKIHKAEVSDE